MSYAVSHNVVQLPAGGDLETCPSSTIFAKTSLLGIEDLHFKIDPITGLKAIIAIHNSKRGAALGGTRCLDYASENDAIEDVIRLAKGMSYKSAFADLPYGGGKAVIMRPRSGIIPDGFFERFGEFIETFKGRFITAVDVGTSVEDMDRIARCTNHVLSTSSSRGDPSHYTARGVLQGIRAAINFHLQRSGLEGVSVAIQGVGKVGFHLANLLHQAGAKLIISDTNPQALKHCVESFPATVTEPEKILFAECDVLAPCALGSCINERTYRHIKARVICGAANNQLASDHIGDKLHIKGVLYIPDFVVNVGGLVHVVLTSSIQADEKLLAIYDSVMDLCQRSSVNREPCHRIANQIAEQRLYIANDASADNQEPEFGDGC